MNWPVPSVKVTSPTPDASRASTVTPGSTRPVVSVHRWGERPRRRGPQGSAAWLTVKFQRVFSRPSSRVAMRNSSIAELWLSFQGGVGVVPDGAERGASGHK